MEEVRVKLEDMETMANDLDMILNMAEDFDVEEAELWYSFFNQYT